MYIYIYPLPCGCHSWCNFQTVAIATSSWHRPGTRDNPSHLFHVRGLEVLRRIPGIVNGIVVRHGQTMEDTPPHQVLRLRFFFAWQDKFSRPHVRLMHTWPVLIRKSHPKHQNCAILGSIGTDQLQEEFASIGQHVFFVFWSTSG